LGSCWGCRSRCSYGCCCSDLVWIICNAR
jgi:hypothetical protein